MTNRVVPYPFKLSEVGVNIATGTTTAVVAAVAGKIIRVYKVLLVAAAAQTLNIEDGATPLTNVMTFATGIPLVLEFDQAPWFTTTAGNALNFVTTTTGQLSGRVYYNIEFPSRE